MALPTYIGTGTFTLGAGAINIPWPTHITNDIGILVVETANEAVTTPSGWTAVASSPQGTGTAAGTAATRLSMFWRRAASAAETAAAIADSGDHQDGAIMVFRGCITTEDPIHVSTGSVNATASTSATLPSVTTTVDDCVVVQAIAHGIDSNTAQLSGWTHGGALIGLTQILNESTKTKNGGGVGAVYGNLSTAGASGTTGVTLATAFAVGMITIALKPPSTAYNSNFFLMF